jgi:chromosomal replication initiation ATPase DnaA|tara:strand:+ start:510 stop:815 length:306 start_codon:yes stop_codon:yes gene_type:complete
MKEKVFNSYATQVASLYGISEAEMFSPDKAKSVVDARYMLMYLCKMRPIRVMVIKELFEKRDLVMHHSTVVHGIKVAEKMMKLDPDFKSAVKSISKEKELA